MRLLESDIARPWTLTELAEELHLAPATWCGCSRTPPGCRRRRTWPRSGPSGRRSCCCTPTSPITSIGRAVGWPDQNYFARRFKAHYGLSATTYRKRFATQAIHLHGHGEPHYG